VMAVPGNLGRKYSMGCNKLIRVNKAALIESAADVAYCLGWELNEAKKGNIQKQIFPELSEQEDMLVNILKVADVMAIDDITYKSGLPVSKTAALLLELEFKGLVSAMPGKRYKLIR